MTKNQSPESRLDLIVKDTEEILTIEDLNHFIKSNQRLKHYIGFEISGRIHLGTGLQSIIKIKDFLDADIDCTIFLADWHTWINDKLGSDRAFIKDVANGYFKEGMKASLKCIGGDPEKLNFVLGSELYHNNDEYWASVIDVSKNTSLSRMQRSITILGRKEGEAVDFAKLIYPAMQVADIFTLGVHIAHSGLDQRKAHVIARDTALKLTHNTLLNNEKQKAKPVAVHHHLILGLRQPPVWPLPAQNKQDIWADMKMSKSDPDTAIFIDDTPDEIRNKVKKAFCPPKETEFNPIMDWTRYLIFHNSNAQLFIKRSERDGGPILFKSYAELKTAYEEGKLHPMDLKSAVADYLIQTLEPVRLHFKDKEFQTIIERLKLFSRK